MGIYSFHKIKDFYKLIQVHVLGRNINGLVSILSALYFFIPKLIVTFMLFPQINIVLQCKKK